MKQIKKILGHYWLVYPMLVLKMFIYFWQTDMLDTMNMSSQWQTEWIDRITVFEPPLITAFFLICIFEVFSFKESKPRRYGFYFVYTFITLLMFIDAAYSSYFGKYVSVNQLYQLASLSQIAGDGNVIGATVSPFCILTWIDYPFVLFWYRIRNKGKTGLIDSFLLEIEKSNHSTTNLDKTDPDKTDTDIIKAEKTKSDETDTDILKAGTTKADKENPDKTIIEKTANKKNNTNIKKKNKVLSILAIFVIHITCYIIALCTWYYYGFNPQNLRSVQKVNHIEFFTYHTNDVLVNVVGKIHRGTADEKSIKKTMEENVPKSEGENYKGVAKGMNLILIQTESLNDFVIGKEYNGQEITPKLNQLLKKDTLYFDHFYSTTGVGNTCDAEFSTLNSLYPNDERECYRMYVDNTYDGLPWLLRRQGYSANAFHGYVKTFWNREEAYKNQGFEHFYSQEELDMTEKSGFGLTDKELFRQSVDILKKEDQPFFSFMITLTNHIPYELDPELASLEVKDSDKGSTFGNYLQTVRYTDEAFGELIQELKDNGMYNNTMIVIYGDHQGLNMETPAVKQKMTEYLGKEYNYDEMLNVPFIVHIPGLGESRTIDTVGGEIDTMPTLANLMDLELKQPYVFGHDLLNAKEGFIAQISYVGEGSFITNDNDMIFTIGKDGTVGSGKVISLLNGSYGNLNETLCQKYSDRAQTLLDTCKEVLDYNLIANYVTH